MKMGPENFGPGSETYARPGVDPVVHRVDGMEDKKKINKKETEAD